MQNGDSWGVFASLNPVQFSLNSTDHWLAFGKEKIHCFKWIMEMNSFAGTATALCQPRPPFPPKSNTPISHPLPQFSSFTLYLCIKSRSILGRANISEKQTPCDYLLVKSVKGRDSSIDGPEEGPVTAAAELVPGRCFHRICRVAKRSAAASGEKSTVKAASHSGTTNVWERKRLTGGLRWK